MRSINSRGRAAGWFVRDRNPRGSGGELSPAGRGVVSVEPAALDVVGRCMPRPYGAAATPAIGNAHHMTAKSQGERR
jgi:hypothetical protein